MVFFIVSLRCWTLCVHSFVLLAAVVMSVSTFGREGGGVIGLVGGSLKQGSRDL